MTESLFHSVFGTGGWFEQVFGRSTHIGWTFQESRLTKQDDVSVLRRELPGWKASDLKVEIKGSVLTITGHRTDPASEVCSFAQDVDFTDTYPIIGNILEDQVTAVLRRGILTIRLPHDKARINKPTRIQVAEA